MPHFAFAAPDAFLAPTGADQTLPEAAEWIIARERELLLPRDQIDSFPRARPDLEFAAIQQVGHWCGQPIMAAAVARGMQAPTGWTWVGLRSLIGVLDEDRLSLAGRAVQLLDWELCHAFCGRCGAATTVVQNERYCRRCDNCGHSAFPRIEPAIIVAVTRPPNEILLARTSRLANGMHSVLAGFVEPGETLEQCAVREVFEETGIRIKNLTYVGSQPWPFPRSLMIGFLAEYASGTIAIDQHELQSAAWFPFDELPPVPPLHSISGALIERAISASKV